MKPSVRQMSALVTVAVLSFFLSACGSVAPEAEDVPTSTTSSEASAKGSVASEDSPVAGQAGEKVEALGSFPKGEIKVVTDANFRKEVLMSDRPVLVNFGAEWCGPCKMVARTLQEIADEQDSLIIAKMNVDENPLTSSSYFITSLPTLNVYQGGQIVKTIIGAKPKAALLAELVLYVR